MVLSKKRYKENIVFYINNKIIDDSITEKIISNIDSDEKIGIDMNNVETINSTLFIKHLLKNKFKLFNLSSETLAYLSLVLKSGYLKSYINYEDFSLNKRELFKRVLKLV